MIARLCLLLLLPLGFAWAGPGFFPLEHASVPDAVRAASRGVFGLFVLGDSFRRVRGEEMAVLRQALVDDDRAVLLTFSLFNRDINSILIDELDAAAPQGYWDIPTIGGGTGFLVNDRSTLASVRHIFTHTESLPEGYGVARSILDVEKVLKGFEPKFFVTDASGQIVFDSRRNPGTRISFSGHPAYRTQLGTEFKKVDEGTAREILDLFILRLPKALPGEPLPLQSGALDAREPLYALGFPNQTRGRAELGVPDSAGRGLRVSQGNRLAEVPAEYSAFLRGLMQSENARKAFLKAVVLSDLDFNTGLSGGPVLNGRGEVVGAATCVRHDPRIPPSEGYTVIASLSPCSALIRWAADH